MKKLALVETTLQFDPLKTYMKNCDPFVFFPLLAIDSINGSVCFMSNDSSRKNKISVMKPFIGSSLELPSKVPP